MDDNFDEIVQGLNPEAQAPMEQYMGSEAYQHMLEVNTQRIESYTRQAEAASRLADAQTANYDAHSYYRYTLGLAVTVGTALAVAWSAVAALRKLAK